LFQRCEYDLDDQDKVWLDLINDARRLEKKQPISENLLEEAIDKFEKEWFNLIKDIPRLQEDIPNGDDIACSICNDTECENSNAIVFCDGCNLAVHQDCYGVPLLPEGQWLCRKCMVSPEAPVSCLFCPNEGGAFKQTSNNKWGHLVCGLWIPEIGFSNPVYMEPIDQVERIPKARWKLNCYICERAQGACIQCDFKTCCEAFHVTCGQRAHLYMEMVSGEEKMLRAFCDRHTPAGTIPSPEIDESMRKFRKEILKSQRRQQPSRSPFKGNGPSTPIRDAHRPNRSPNGKAARAHQKNYDVLANVAPKYIYDRVLSHLEKHKLADKHDVVHLLARYWTLKRGSRRGAALLKRLHLEVGFLNVLTFLALDCRFKSQQ
jgi:hypothetical protein